MFVRLVQLPVALGLLLKVCIPEFGFKLAAPRMYRCYLFKIKIDAAVSRMYSYFFHECRMCTGVSAVAVCEGHACVTAILGFRVWVERSQPSLVPGAVLGGRCSGPGRPLACPASFQPDQVVPWQGRVRCNARAAMMLGCCAQQQSDEIACCI
jgi:hypothetical protein